MNHVCRFSAFALLAAVVASSLSAGDAKPAKLPPAATAKIDFDTDIKPLLAAHCVKCHGPAKQKGGLRLDTAEHANTGGNTGPVIVTGKSTDSHLLLALAGHDPRGVGRLRSSDAAPGSTRGPSGAA